MPPTFYFLPHTLFSDAVFVLVWSTISVNRKDDSRIYSRACALDPQREEEMKDTKDLFLYSPHSFKTTNYINSASTLWAKRNLIVRVSLRLFLRLSLRFKLSLRLIVSLTLFLKVRLRISLTLFLIVNLRFNPVVSVNWCHRLNLRLSLRLSIKFSLRICLRHKFNIRLCLRFSVSLRLNLTPRITHCLKTKSKERSYTESCSAGYPAKSKWSDYVRPSVWFSCMTFYPLVCEVTTLFGFKAVWSLTYLFWNGAIFPDILWLWTALPNTVKHYHYNWTINAPEFGISWRLLWLSIKGFPPQNKAWCEIVEHITSFMISQEDSYHVLGVKKSDVLLVWHVELQWMNFSKIKRKFKVKEQKRSLASFLPNKMFIVTLVTLTFRHMICLQQERGRMFEVSKAQNNIWPYSFLKGFGSWSMLGRGRSANHKEHQLLLPQHTHCYICNSTFKSTLELFMPC